MTLQPKQEAFCMAYIETGNASEAYRLSYEAEKMSANAVSVEASRMLDSPKISLRIKSLQEPIIQRHKVTIDSLLDELEQARQIALKADQASAAISATMGKAKITGYDKQVIDHLSSDGSFTPSPTRIELVAPGVNS